MSEVGGRVDRLRAATALVRWGHRHDIHLDDAVTSVDRTDIEVSE